MTGGYSRWHNNNRWLQQVVTAGGYSRWLQQVALQQVVTAGGYIMTGGYSRWLHNVHKLLYQIIYLLYIKTQMTMVSQHPSVMTS